MKTACAALALWSTLHPTNALRGARSLQQQGYESTKTAWPECEQQGYDAARCQDFIQADVANHVIPNIQVKISKPRTPEELVATGNKVKVTTNYLGIVTGDDNDGLIYYPFLWETATANETVGPWNCTGMGVLECCHDVIQADMTEPNILGQYMNCFVTEPGLDVETDSNEASGVVYYSYLYVDGEYERTKISLAEIEAEEQSTVAQLDALKSRIADVLSTGDITYESLELLLDDLLVATRAHLLGAAQNLVTEVDPLMRASEGAGSVLDAADGSELAVLLEGIVMYIEKYEAEGIHPGAFVLVRTTEDASEVTQTPELVVDYRLADTTGAVEAPLEGEEANVPTTPEVFFPETPTSGAVEAPLEGEEANVPTTPEVFFPDDAASLPPPALGDEMDTPPGVPPAMGDFGGPGGPGGPGGAPGWIHGDFGPNGPPVNRYCSRGPATDPIECGDICGTPADCGPPSEKWKCNTACSPLANNNAGGRGGPSRQL